MVDGDRSEYLRAAHVLMRRHRRPMTPHELVDLGLGEGLFPDSLSGRTPAKTMGSQPSVHVRNNGESSTFSGTSDFSGV
jgi:hypothetical protein